MKAKFLIKLDILFRYFTVQSKKKDPLLIQFRNKQSATEKGSCFFWKIKSGNRDIIHTLHAYRISGIYPNRQKY